MLDGSFPAVPPLESSDESRLDELYRALGHHRRRSLLRELHDCDGTLTIDELAERVAEREANRPSDGVPDDDLETVRLTLHHAHLPKLAAADVVDYDASIRTVEFRTLTGEG